MTPCAWIHMVFWDNISSWPDAELFIRSNDDDSAAVTPGLSKPLDLK